MQISNISIQQHYGTPFRKLNENQSEINKETAQNNGSQNAGHLNNKKRVIHREVMDLKQIQSDFNLAEQSESYLGNVQKVLKRFKEVNQQIVDSAVFSGSKKVALKDQIKGLANEYPVIEEFTSEMGNLIIKSFLGTESMNDPFNEVQAENIELFQKGEVDFVLGQLANKEKELKSDMDSLESLVSHKDFQKGNSKEMDRTVIELKAEVKTQQAVHHSVSSEKAISLLN